MSDVELDEGMSEERLVDIERRFVLLPLKKVKVMERVEDLRDAIVELHAEVRRLRPVPTVEESSEEPCAFIGCEAPAIAGVCACREHWEQVPTPEQIIYREAMADLLSASDVPRARLEARLRVGAVLRGVRA